MIQGLIIMLHAADHGHWFATQRILNPLPYILSLELDTREGSARRLRKDSLRSINDAHHTARAWQPVGGVRQGWPI